MSAIRMKTGHGREEDRATLMTRTGRLSNPLQITLNQRITQTLLIIRQRQKTTLTIQLLLMHTTRCCKAMRQARTSMESGGFPTSAEQCLSSLLTETGRCSMLTSRGMFGRHNRALRANAAIAVIPWSPNADSTACGIGRTGNPKTAILGGSRRRNGIGRGRTNFRSRGERLDILRKVAKGIGPTLKRREDWS